MEMDNIVHKSYLLYKHTNWDLLYIQICIYDLQDLQIIHLYNWVYKICYEYLHNIYEGKTLCIMNWFHWRNRGQDIHLLNQSYLSMYV